MATTRDVLPVLIVLQIPWLLGSNQPGDEDDNSIQHVKLAACTHNSFNWSWTFTFTFFSCQFGQADCCCQPGRQACLECGVVRCGGQATTGHLNPVDLACRFCQERDFTA